MDYKDIIKKKSSITILLIIILGTTILSSAEIQDTLKADTEIITASSSNAIQEDKNVSTPSNIKNNKVEIYTGF